MTFSIMDIIVTLSIMDIIVTLSIMTLDISTTRHYAKCRYAECHYAECHYTECRRANYICHIFKLQDAAAALVMKVLLSTKQNQVLMF